MVNRLLIKIGEVNDVGGVIEGSVRIVILFFFFKQKTAYEIGL